MMPARISLARLVVPVGEQELTLDAGSGQGRSLRISARDDRPVVALFRIVD